MPKLKSFACLIDNFGEIQQANPSFSLLIGLSATDLKGLPLHSLLHDIKNQDTAKERILKAIKELKEDRAKHVNRTIHLEFTNHLSEKIQTQWHISYANPNDTEEGFFAIGWKDEEGSVLSDVYQKMQQVTAYTSDSIIITDSNGIIEYQNETFSQLTEFHPIEIIGKNPTHFLSLPEDMGEFHHVRELLIHGQDWEGQIRIRKKNNEVMSLSVNVIALRNKDKEISHYLCLGKDISQLQSLKKQIQELQRLESLSTLVNGVTHKFNNIIAGISGHSELLSMTYPDDLAIKKRIEQILLACNKGREFISELNSFSRKEESRLRLIDISPVIRHISQFAKQICPSGIEVKEDIAEDIPEIMANTDEIHQAILNIVTNSIQAMEGKKGAINIRLSPDLFYSTPSVLIEIEDEGTGIPDDIKDRILEPLFTTKSLADASGMGLAVTHGIIQRHGGSLELQSQVNIGSNFCIRLPIFNASTQNPENKRTKKKKDLLLLAGDENFFLRSGKAMLEEMGYNIETIKGFDLATETLNSQLSEFALLIFDFQRGTDNIDIATKARALSSKIPIILMANMEKMPNTKQIHELQIDQVVYKPCPINKIGHTIRMLLDNNSLL